MLGGRDNPTPKTPGNPGSRARYCGEDDVSTIEETPDMTTLSDRLTTAGAVATDASRPDLERVTFWTGPFSRRVWREQGYLLLAFVLGLVAFVYVVLTVSLIPSLAITVVGLFVGGGLVLGARAWGGMHRTLGRGLLRIDVPAPARWKRGHGFWRTLGSMLGDGPGWRALGFMFLEFVLGLTAFCFTITFLIGGIGSLTYWYWSGWLPQQLGSDGLLHRGSQIGPDIWAEGTGWNIAYVVLGIVLILLWARLVVGFAHAFRLLTRELLGPSRGSVRLAEVTRTRSNVVVDADARLRQIERDLHDGTQARLVAVAMALGEAREQLADGGDSDEAMRLVSQAHSGTKDAMTELRSLAQGIRPASLDAGLVLALETLASRSPLPVTLDAEADLAASPEVEAIAYYCVAELLTNVAKHARATGAYVLLETVTAADSDEAQLVIRVRDDGVGGARITTPTAAGGSGLHGLQQRIAAVDGTVTVESPVGGPTVATVILPLSASR